MDITRTKAVAYVENLPVHDPASLVDERITGHKPSSLDFAEAAAMPLTVITAWEALFDKLGLGRDSAGTLLVMGAAGGVGSMVVQLARHLTGLTVVATASRPDSVAWAREMGAHHVVDHHRLAEQVRQVAPDGIDYVFSPFSTGNVEGYAEVLNVRGAVVAIDDPQGLDLLPLKPKSISWHWEFMFTRPLYQRDSRYQHELLDEVGRLVDAGIVRTTLTTRLSPLDAATLRQAHRQVESSSTIGKVVVQQPQ
jgi:NADPH:quinone reductase